MVALCGVPDLAQRASPKAHAKTECRAVAGQIFKCPEFGFSYEIPFGWVDRTKEMQPDDTGGDGQQPYGPPGSAAPRTLLSIFERPPGAPGETIDSAVVIAAESLKDYRGVHTAADYLGPVTELAQQRGFGVTNEPYAFVIGKKPLARADFSKSPGKALMCQSTLAMIADGYIVSFTFVGGSEDEVEDLISRLRFTLSAAAHP
jgi:hypothetical protein